MASRQLGKLRQWAGEVIATREKTTFSDEFKDLERDIEFRREGARRLYFATETYQKYLSKKKLNEALDEAEKLLPIDALGVVMIVHGEEYPDESVFGNSLVKFGRAHCKVATLQEAFAVTLKDTIMTFLSRFEEETKEYDVVRKKLESRRLSYDAALAKAERCKNSKKEKERRDAEEELERAQYRYEEAMEDVRAHMHAIQEHEAAQHRELTGFLDLEINYVQQYLDVLTEVKSDWQTKTNSIRRGNSTRSQAKSQRQTKYSSFRVPLSVRSDPTPPQELSDEEEDVTVASTRRSSSLHRKAGTGSLPNSRPTSRAPSRMSTRKRSDSSTTVGEREKDTEKEKTDKPKRMSVTGWASSAVGSVASIGRRNKDKERFSALQDDSDGHYYDRGDSPPAARRRSNSFRSTEKTSPMKRQRKVVRAVRDFQGSFDELSFNAGDEIVVINEVLDEWWLGSLNDQTGLFPTSFVELPARRSPQIPDQWRSEGRDSEDDQQTHAPHPGGVADGAITSDDDVDINRKPLSPLRSPFYAGVSDVTSITSSGHEDEESSLVPRKLKGGEDDAADSKWTNNPGPPPIPMRRSTTATDVNTIIVAPSFLSTSAPKKSAQPPPPPPRRSNTVSGMTPPIPERKLHGFRLAASSSQDSRHDDYNGSPFESESDFDFASNRATTLGDQNPF